MRPAPAQCAPDRSTATGKKSKDLTLEAAVFAVEVKPHLVHETVRAELNARRAGTHAAKSRGFVAGGRAKPWRQKGTGRARAGHDPRPAVHGRRRRVPADAAQLRRQGEQKVRRAALRAALSAHTRRRHARGRPRRRLRGPSTRTAAELLGTWGKDLPLLVVAEDEQENVIKSFRNLPGVSSSRPRRLEVAELVWARSLLVDRELASSRWRGGPGNGATPSARSCSLRSCPRRATTRSTRTGTRSRSTRTRTGCRCARPSRSCSTSTS